MRCPRCRLINPETAQRCDCGYDFASRRVEVPYGIGLTDKSVREEPGFWTPFGIWPFGISTFKLWKRYFSTQPPSWEMHNTAGQEAYEQGRYTDAEKAWLAALKEAESFAPEAPRLALSLNNLANVYHSQGKYAEAEPLYKRALAIVEKAFGQEHPNVATSLNNLGGVYVAQGKYAEADPLFKRALAIQENALGPEHPYVPVTLENYAKLLRHMGRGTGARLATSLGRPASADRTTY